jgi:hypothetical protein
MPIEGAGSISELDPVNPDSNAPAGEGDDQLRQLKEVLLASFPALDGLITNSGATGSSGDVNPPDAATFSRLFTDVRFAAAAAIPKNGIIMFSGLESEIPTGWYLCNGSNGTPDLRNRFVLAGDYDSSVYTVGQQGGEQWNIFGAFPVVDGLPSLDPSVTVNGDTGTTNVNVNAQAHEHPYLPPFYTLALIQYKGV